MRLTAIGAVLAIGLGAGCGSNHSSSDQDNAGVSFYPTEAQGISASLKYHARRTLTQGKPLRLEFTLANTTNVPVTLHEIGDSAMPHIHGAWGGDFSGLSGGGTKEVTLLPGESFSRWVELHQVQPSDARWIHGIRVRSEESGLRAYFSAQEKHESVLFEIGFDDQLFTGSLNDGYQPVISTGPIEIRLR